MPPFNLCILAGCTAPVKTEPDTTPQGGEQQENNTEFPAHDGYRIYAVDNTGWEDLFGNIGTQDSR